MINLKGDTVLELIKKTIAIFIGLTITATLAAVFLANRFDGSVTTPLIVFNTINIIIYSLLIIDLKISNEALSDRLCFWQRKQI